MALAAVLASSAGFGAVPGMRVVVQLNDANQANIEAGLRNVENILTAAEKEGKHPEITLVVFGAAMKFFTKAVTSDVGQAVKSISSHGSVKWLACENTLKKLNLKVNDLVPGFTPTPSGAWAIVSLQKTGYVYFRP